MRVIDTAISFPPCGGRMRRLSEAQPSLAEAGRGVARPTGAHRRRRYSAKTSRARPGAASHPHPTLPPSRGKEQSACGICLPVSSHPSALNRALQIVDAALQRELGAHALEAGFGQAQRAARDRASGAAARRTDSPARPAAPAGRSRPAPPAPRCRAGWSRPPPASGSALPSARSAGRRGRRPRRCSWPARRYRRRDRPRSTCSCGAEPCQVM